MATSSSSLSGWIPGSFKDFHKRITSSDPNVAAAASRQLDAAMDILWRSQVSQQGVINGTQSGQLIVTGKVASVPTGLKIVHNVLAGVVGDLVTPLDYWIGARLSFTVPGAIDISVWVPTSAAVTTPIMSTQPLNIAWIANGEG